MNLKDNFLNLLNITKSIITNNLTSQKNSPSNNNNNNQQDSNYFQGNEKEKTSNKKDESECENDKNIYNFLTRDIINSINDIFSEPNNNSKTEPKKETIQDKTEPYKDKKDSPKQKNSEVNNIKFEEKETKNEFSFNFGFNKFSDFLNNNLFGNKDENNTEKKTNNWNFNMSPSKIFNIDNKNENNKLNNNNINSDENNNIIKSKETTNIKNESFKFNFGGSNNNNKGFPEKKESFDNNSSNKNFSIFPNLNNYINFEFKSNNKQTQNKYTENNYINKDNKIMTSSFYEHKSSNNKFNLNNFNLNVESKETKQQQTSIINSVNNNLQGNNKFTFFNNSINFSNDNMTNNNNHISLGKYIDNLDQDKYLITMFGKPGWICRLCNNFNFKSRNICNRCNAIKAPRTKEEIKEKEEFDKMMKKKIKEKKTDWLCLNCQNINYSFRKNCNRCGVERKKEFPPIFYQSNQNLNEKTNNAKNVDENEDKK